MDQSGLCGGITSNRRAGEAMTPTHRLNGNGDLMMVGELRPYIGHEVEFVKVTKSGLIQIRCADGALVSVPKRNLDPLPPSAPGDA